MRFERKFHYLFARPTFVNAIDASQKIKNFLFEICLSVLLKGKSYQNFQNYKINEKLSFNVNYVNN